MFISLQHVPFGENVNNRQCVQETLPPGKKKERKKLACFKSRVFPCRLAPSHIPGYIFLPNPHLVRAINGNRDKISDLKKGAFQG